MSTLTSARVVDPYDINGVHDVVRSELPSVERQRPINGLQSAAFLGVPPSPDILDGVSPRWWFVSKDETEVLQVQERFVASNWRRRDAIPGTSFDYPGFDSILAKATDRISRIVKHSSESAKPTACELMYDNLIPLRRPDGTKLGLSDVLSEIDRQSDSPVVNFQMSWLESIPGLPDETSLLQVQISLVGLAVAEEPEPLTLIKLAFTAVAARSNWEEVFDFWKNSHEHIRKRLMELTTREAQELWSPK